MASVKDVLTRMFSNNLVVSTGPGGQVRTMDVGNVQSISKNYAQNRYQRLYGNQNQGQGWGHGYGGTSSAVQVNRLQLFRDYENMDDDPIISSALDVYADEISTTNEYGEVLRVKCENGDVKSQVENLLFNVLDVDYNLRWWSRTMLKYGDSFLKLHLNDEYGVFGATPMSPYAVQRYEPEDHRTRVQFYHNEADEPYENWEVAHFRLQADSNFFPYGRPVIENARSVWKQLRLTEEAMLIHRIMRAPEKRVFKIDVGGIEPDAIDSYMNEIIADVQQTPLVDQKSGQYNLEFNLQNMLEDFFFPVRGDQTGTEVKSLQGLQYQAIEDVEYLRKKLMSALRIPNAFLGYEGQINGKCIAPDTEIPTLSGEDVTAESIVERYQSSDADPVYVYSYDFEEDQVVPGLVVEAEWTREDAEVVDVVLGNGEVVRTTPDHGFILRDGTVVDAQHLQPGDSLRTAQRETAQLSHSANEYERVWQPADGERQWTHQMVDRYLNGEITDNGRCYNKVVEVREVGERIDTVNIEVADRNDNHNFLVSQGVVIKNSTLAQESLKFAENVRKLQRMMKSELEKIASVDLIAKGYDAADVTSFQIKFTNPSIIAEQERIDFLSRKLGVARDAVDDGFFSTDWVYREIFDMSDREIREQRSLMVNDMKRAFRRDQIEREGNDPVKTGQSFGTPGDLAASGSRALSQIDLDGDDEAPDTDGEEELDTGGMQGMRDRLGIGSADVRPQYYQGGSPLAVSTLSDSTHQGLVRDTMEGSDSLILESEEPEDPIEREAESFMSDAALSVFDVDLSWLLDDD